MNTKQIIKATEDSAALQAINAKLDRMGAVVDDLDRRMQTLDDLMEDLIPTAHSAMGILQRRMAELEKAGIVAFAAEAAQVGKTVATSFSPEDVRLLGANVVGILETVRSLTQKEVLHVADRAAGALGRPAEAKPAGTLRLLKELRDPDVRRGMTKLVGVLREMGENGDGSAVADVEQGEEQ
ncbi:MAG: DUF1641 domain-containing protein [Gemmatimonadota bacterium]